MLYYHNGPVGNRVWFSFLPDGDLIGIDQTFDRSDWRKVYIRKNDIPDKYVGSYEAESKQDYYNVIKSVLSRG